MAIPLRKENKSVTFAKEKHRTVNGKRNGIEYTDAVCDIEF